MPPHSPVAPVEFYRFAPGPALRRPLLLVRVAAGFPSAAEDYIDRPLDLNKRLVANPPATYFLRVAGESMAPTIPDGALLVVDCSRQPWPGCVVVAAVHGELTIKRFQRRDGRPVLVPDNPGYPVIELPETDGAVWGVVTAVINERP